MRALNRHEVQEISGAGDLWQLYHTTTQQDVTDTYYVLGGMSALAGLGAWGVLGQQAGAAVACAGALVTLVCAMDLQSKVGTNPYEVRNFDQGFNGTSTLEW